jgi:chloramphenicol 3-O-phosphotransferase
LLESGLSSITSNLNSIASNAFLNTGINTIGNLISERQGIIGKSINVNGSFNPDIENKGIE